MSKLKKHPTFIYADDIKQICKPLHNLGIKYFSHVIIDNSDKFSAICTNPEFGQLYLDKKYYNFDIHQIKIPNEVNYICWDMMQTDSQLAELYNDLNGFSLGHSFTIIRQDESFKHYYHFSADLYNYTINEVYMRHYDLLRKFILYFTEQVNARQEFKLAYDIKFSLEDSKQDVFDDKCDLLLPINRTYISHQTYLTPREIECMQWLTIGKTLDELAIILSITKRTVKHHLASIKKKLGCNNLFQLGLAWQAFLSGRSPLPQ